ncbi:hypothetical protein ASF69_11955 [Rhizobium sp. Leaf311]|nr:hypothetical protein ASF69_11955 [Rhizobium sp. Leaf311]
MDNPKRSASRKLLPLISIESLISLFSEIIMRPLQSFLTLFDEVLEIASRLFDVAVAKLAFCLVTHRRERQVEAPASHITGKARRTRAGRLANDRPFCDKHGLSLHGEGTG